MNNLDTGSRLSLRNRETEKPQQDKPCCNNPLPLQLCSCLIQHKIFIKFIHEFGTHPFIDMDLHLYGMAGVGWLELIGLRASLLLVCGCCFERK